MEEIDELQELIAGITSENLHGEVSFGQPVGHEVWPAFDNDSWGLESPPVAD
ncbi:AbrB/MazE/SpoVT family DNA-binding domain-containing protein [Burkholderia pseudomallei]|uniref:AbrB/MazE/SpoVT family DNA-binding domain-containing protein n=1 Tax=Burkholderia pseudomallei TaxID=28450 RepID=UPI0012BA7522|nr:hypothetical protein [Burkholderia pseudomallei]MCS6596437.1 hypothetical protein [Burkholderia pseudomallei]